MKFDYIIGNPPYQDETLGDNKGFAPPVYDKFMNSSYEIADKVELIHPARFLFNAGSTPKAWNEKMLNDSHLKVLHYESDASNLFPGVDIKGGVVVTYHDQKRDFGAIGTFTAFSELNGIVKKCAAKDEENSISSIIYTQVRFDLDALYQDYPDYENIIGSKGKDRRFRNNAFEKINLFSEDRVNDDDIAVLGVLKNKRMWRYIPKKYVDMSHENLNCWKALCPRANGTGVFGETLSPIAIGEPYQGYTQTFIGIGSFDSKSEAEAVIKYVKSKFGRTLLDVLKVTQDNDRGVWKLIPLQDFTSNSDIDWSASIPNIDHQLYRKYGLTQEEIDFIETHVKAME